MLTKKNNVLVLQYRKWVILMSYTQNGEHIKPPKESFAIYLTDDMLYDKHHRFAAVFHRLISPSTSGRSLALPFLDCFFSVGLFDGKMQLHTLKFRPYQNKPDVFAHQTCFFYFLSANSLYTCFNSATK